IQKDNLMRNWDEAVNKSHNVQLKQLLHHIGVSQSSDLARINLEQFNKQLYSYHGQLNGLAVDPLVDQMREIIYYEVLKLDELLAQTAHMKYGFDYCPNQPLRLSDIPSYETKNCGDVMVSSDVVQNNLLKLGIHT